MSTLLILQVKQQHLLKEQRSIESNLKIKGGNSRGEGALLRKKEKKLDKDMAKMQPGFHWIRNS